MGQMKYRRTRADVRVWPADEAARKALHEYLEELEQSPGGIVPGIGGGGLDFRGADLSGLDLHEADFIEAQLTGVRLIGTDLDRADLIGANLTGADLTESLMHKAEGRECRAQNAILARANLDRAEFQRADLSEADLSEAVLGRVVLTGADLRGANLARCGFGGIPGPTYLSHARLAGATVTGASGPVSGPCDIGENDTPHLIDGDELQAWFTDRGAQVEVVA